MTKKAVKSVKKKALKKETTKKKIREKTPAGKSARGVSRTDKGKKATPAASKGESRVAKAVRAGKPKKASANRRATSLATPAGTSAQLPNWERLLKKQLIANREEIVREAKAEIAKYIKGETRQLVESVLDDGDWSVIDLSEDINLRRLAAHREVLLKIDEALRKIREGTYGTCEECGEAINSARLKVLPFAIYCRDCQEKKEEMEKVEGEEL